MLTVCTWWWGNKYGRGHVTKLIAGVRRHLKQAHRFLLVTEWSFDVPGADRVGIPDLKLTRVPGCFARLRMFDPVWQARHHIDDRLVCLDLDTIVTGALDPLFDRPEPFVILQGANATNPCPYNGSLMMLRPGAHPDVWSHFSFDAASKVPFHDFPDDQAWLAHKVPNAAGWKCGPESGVYAFLKPRWPRGDELAQDARIVSFPGKRDPSMFTHLGWVKDHWR